MATQELADEEFQSINSNTAINEVEGQAVYYFAISLNRKVKLLKADSLFISAFTWAMAITGRVIAISCIIDLNCYNHLYIKVNTIGIQHQVSLPSLLIFL